MTVLAINHDVADYNAWKQVFDEFGKAERGVLFHRINRNVDNPNNITVVHGFESVEAARAFITDPELAAAMGRAGATSAPRIEIYDEVEAMTY
jgi:quinol monooxygenase YgiN